MTRHDKSQFQATLQELESDFSSMKPEVELSCYDRENKVEGYVVVWNTYADSPIGRFGKGGTRITPDLTLPEVRMLARFMALKTAAAGLPFGGAKSGLRANPDAPDFEQTYRAWVRMVKPILREHGGRFGGFGLDIGARPELPRWACDELGSMKCFTGKPVDMGGTDYDEEGIAGLGVVVATEALYNFRKEKISASRGSIQGMGAMGAAILRYYSELGGKIEYISDFRFGGTYDVSRGMSEELRDSLIRRDFRSSLNMLEKGKYPKLDLDAALYQDVDILFPSAIQEVIRADNAPRIQAKYIAEGANNPTTEEAKTILFDKGVIALPDFIANPGGIIAAFIEMTSNATPEENVRTRINVLKAKELTRTKINENVEQLLNFALPRDIELSKAGKYLALNRILGRAPESEIRLRVGNV